MHDLREHTHVVESVAFAPETAERTLAMAGTGSSSTSGDKPRANGKAVATSGDDRGPSEAWGDGGVEDEGLGAGGTGRRFMVSGSRDKAVKLWNATVGQCLMTFVSGAVLGGGVGIEGSWYGKCMFVFMPSYLDYL